MRNWHKALTKVETATDGNLNRAVRSLPSKNRPQLRTWEEESNDGGRGQPWRMPVPPAEFQDLLTMAYMNQERKAQLSPAIKAHCKRYGVKATIGVHHHSTLRVTISSGKLDLCRNSFEACHEQYSRKYPHSTPQTLDDYKAIEVNPYWCHEHFTGACRDFIVELVRLMNIGNHDNSDIMTDYFDVGWYVSVNIGTWDKPYQLVK